MNAQGPGIHSEQQATTLAASQSGEALREFLALMENTESPRTFLTWSLIATAAALLGRNSHFQSGPNHILAPNLFVILVGPPGVRKSTGIRYVEKLVKHTSLNFGPTDSGGQRHGLMSALTGLHRANAFHRRTVEQGPLSLAMIHQRPSADIFLVAPELGRLMGNANREIADFLVDLYDGAKIDYQTKIGETKIWNPLATLLGATTPSSLATILPENAVGHGILSRVIFVFDDKRYKDVPLPDEESDDWYERRSDFEQRLRWIDGNRANFNLTDGARVAYISLYSYVPILDDARLSSYKERRADSLLKVAMALAALRCDTTIIESDILLSHELLAAAEPQMRRALEFFGKNRIFQGRMLMLEFLKNSPGRSASPAELRAAAASELNQKEAMEAVQSMLASGELVAYGGELLILGSAKNEIAAAKAKRKR